MKVIDYLARKLGYAKRSSGGPAFPAAQISRLTSDWTTSTLSSDGQLSADLSTLRARSRNLRDGNDYANKFLALVKSGVVGDEGIVLDMKIRGPDRWEGDRPVKGKLDIRKNRLIEDAWADWGRAENCTVHGNLTWRDVQNIVVETVAVDGEALIRFIRDPSRPYGFALQLMESDYLDIDHQEEKPGGRRIRMGVEIDEWHKPVAYHIMTKNPHDAWYYSSITQTRRVRIPAEDMLHIFLPRRPEQTRGWPWMSTAMLRIQMLGAFQEASLVAARVAASKMGFFEIVGDAKYTGEDDGSGNKLMDAQPGSFETLPAGMKLSSWDPDFPQVNFGDFCKDISRGVAAGLQVSYNSLANDWESTSFSSGRMSTIDEREFYKHLQRWFIDRLCQPVFEDWLDMALLTGSLGDMRLSNFDKINQLEWKPRRWSYINPVDEVKAYSDAIASGLTSRTRVLAEMNIDVEDVFSELKAEDELAKALGIQLPTGKPASPAAAPEKPEANGEDDAEDEEEDEDEASVAGNGRMRL